MRRIILIAASVIVSGIFLWLALRDVNLAEVGASLASANPAWVAAALCALTLGLATRAIRWRGLVGFKVPLIQAFHIMNITFLINQLPLRAGEVARSLLATRSGVPVITAATSIVVERLLDTLLVVVLLAAALSRLPAAPETASRAAGLFGVAAVVGFAVLVVFARFPNIAHTLLDFFTNRITLLQKLPLRSLLDQVLDGLKPLTNPSGLIFAVGWTLIAWACSLMTFYCLLHALNIQDVDLLLATVLGVCLASFSIAVPVSVASIGPFQAAVRAAGDAVGMATNLSTSLGFLFHGVNLLGYCVFGVIGLLAMGVSLADVLNGPQQSAAAQTPSIS